MATCNGSHVFRFTGTFFNIKFKAWLPAYRSAVYGKNKASDAAGIPGVPHDIYIRPSLQNYVGVAIDNPIAPGTMQVCDQ